MSLRRAAGLATLLAALACRGEGGDARPAPPAADETSRTAPASQAAEASALVGRWAGAHDQVEFFAGGRLLLRRGDVRGTGRYEFVEPGRVLVTYEGLLGNALPGDYRVRAAGDSLALCETDRPARCIGYARVTDPAQAPPLRPASPGVPRLAEAPRVEAAPAEARAAEAGPPLKQAYALQLAYRAEHGAYAPAMDSLRAVGWEPPAPRFYHPPRVTQSGARLCMVMEPRDGDLWPVHIDDEGDLGRGRVCN